MDNKKKKFFLIIKQNHFALNVLSEDNEILFNEEILYDDLNFGNINDDIKKFLDKNIFKIEKKFQPYIEEIYLIFNDKSFVNIDISLIKDFKYSFS